MNSFKADTRVNRSLFSFRSYIIFFMLVSFIVSCCFILFFNVLQEKLGAKFTEPQINYAAKVTFVNVAFLSLLCTVIDGVRRKLMVERPVKRILQATHSLTRGDFSVRIKPLHSLDGMNEFDVIIEDFNEMAKELSGIETLRTDFIANVSHELKTPLSAIQGYATMLQAQSLSEVQREAYAKAITESTRRLSELVTNILKLNKLENQQIFTKQTEYELNEQLCECLLSFEDIWESKDINVEAKLDETVTIFSDPELLMLVWNNLISNAIKFTKPDGTISVQLKADKNFAVVVISDTGCGMPQEVGKHIFEKFYQGDTSHSAQGNGLGLALVKRVMDITGGEIFVSSTEGIGSCFTVKLPLINK